MFDYFIYDSSYILQQWRIPEQAVFERYLGLKQTPEDTKNSKWKELEEAVKQWKDRENFVEAKCKVIQLLSFLCIVICC